MGCMAFTCLESRQRTVVAMSVMGRNGVKYYPKKDVAIVSIKHRAHSSTIYLKVEFGLEFFEQYLTRVEVAS